MSTLCRDSSTSTDGRAPTFRLLACSSRLGAERPMHLPKDHFWEGHSPQVIHRAVTSM
jgi:hypothetical protein